MSQIDIFDEIIVDNFAGGGGASTGIELAAGRPVAIAINHDPDAILLHKTNHPYTEHLQDSVWAVDPVAVCQGRPVGLAWFSPDCKHFSKAKGAALVDRNIRGLAWIVLRWAALVRPRVIMLENVEEFQTWGPVRKGKPVKSKAGHTFHRWKQQLTDLGYTIDHRELVAADYLSRGTGVKCGNCGHELEAYYCEERLYLVECPCCKTKAMVMAVSPADAAYKTFGNEVIPLDEMGEDCAVFFAHTPIDEPPYYVGSTIDCNFPWDDVVCGMYLPCPGTDGKEFVK